MRIDFTHDAEAIARGQRQSIRKLADKIEAGEILTPLESRFVAAVLRGAVDIIQAPRRQGPASKLPDGDEAAMQFVDLTKRNTRARAMEIIAEEYDVSTEAVRKYLAKDSREQRVREFVAQFFGDTNQ